MPTEPADAFPPLLLTEGGPGAAFLRRLGIAPLGRGSIRTAVVLAAVAWLPLLVLAAVQGVALAGPRIPFVYDLAAHVRFLVAVPVLVLAEIPIGLRLREIAAYFVNAGLVAPADHPRYAEVIRETLRWRDSRVAELVVLGAAYAGTFSLLVGSGIQGGDTWHAPDASGTLPLAGKWYAFVAVPIFQFLIYRWLYRMLVWTRFLHRISRLPLRLMPTHPDNAGGIGFLGKSCLPFASLLFAVSAVVSSAIASRVLFEGAALGNFQITYAALFVIALLVFTAPLLVFVPVLLGLKRRGLREYGMLAQRYTQLFDGKWVRGTVSDEPLLGSADIQSLADLGNSYEVIKNMRALPLTRADFFGMALPGVLPAIPLAATVMPIGDILKNLLRLLA
jgi:hypothetical protein